MKIWMAGVLAVLVAAISPVLSAADAGVKTLTRTDDPLVKEIESNYSKYVAATGKGDLKTFKSYRTAKRNAEIPPNAIGADLKGMAEMFAPSMAGYKFLQLDVKADLARAAYAQQKTGELNIRVLMFEKEGGVWKIGDSADSANIGQTPKLADALAKALKNPLVQFK